MGIQFEALFQDNLYFELGKHANEMAEKLAVILKNCGYSFYVHPCTNQLFPILPVKTVDKLLQEFKFYVQNEVDERHYAVRLVTSWATTRESVDKFQDFLENL